jgi:hypothetical protein
MRRPIVIPMEDELIHTEERPYCNDQACPCHTLRSEQEPTPLTPPRKTARKDGRRKRGEARRQKKGAPHR